MLNRNKQAVSSAEPSYIPSDYMMKTKRTKEVPVATKRLGEDRNVKSEITDCSGSTPQ